MLYNFNHLGVVSNFGFMLFLLVIFVSFASLSNEYSLSFYHITTNKGDEVENCFAEFGKHFAVLILIYKYIIITIVVDTFKGLIYQIRECT